VGYVKYKNVFLDCCKLKKKVFSYTSTVQMYVGCKHNPVFSSLLSVIRKMPDSSSFSWPYIGLLEHNHSSLLPTRQWSVEWFSFIFRKFNVSTFGAV
jgi:hypothetical protein